MKEIFKNILQSFSTGDSGFSARKLTAWVTVAMIVLMHFRYVTDENMVKVLIIDCIFVAFLLGLVTFEQILKFKNGNTENTKGSTSNNSGSDL